MKDNLHPLAVILKKHGYRIFFEKSLINKENEKSERKEQTSQVVKKNETTKKGKQS